jgi:hypothetical protein
VPQSYSLAEVPAAVEGASRFALASTPAGWSVAPREMIGRAYRELLNARRAGMEALQAPRAVIQLRAVVRLGDGSYTLADRGEPFSAAVAAKPQRPGQRSSIKPGPETLDDAFLGGDAFEKVPDDVLWSSALATAQAHALEGEALLTLNDAVALLVLVRCGATTVSSDDLPTTARIRQVAA